MIDRSEHVANHMVVVGQQERERSERQVGLTTVVARYAAQQRCNRLTTFTARFELAEHRGSSVAETDLIWPGVAVNVIDLKLFDPTGWHALLHMTGCSLSLLVIEHHGVH